MRNVAPLKQRFQSGVVKLCNIVECLATKHSQSDQLLKQTAGLMLFVYIQISRGVFQFVMQIKVIDSPGDECHARMGSYHFSGKRKLGFSLLDDFTWSTFLGILCLHPFDYSFLVDWPRLRLQNHY